VLPIHSKINGIGALKNGVLKLISNALTLLSYKHGNKALIHCNANYMYIYRSIIWAFNCSKWQQNCL